MLQSLSPWYAEVMGCGAVEATGLGCVLLLSTLVCFKPTELIWASFFFRFINFPMLPPLPGQPVRQRQVMACALHVRREDR